MKRVLILCMIMCLCIAVSGCTKDVKPEESSNTVSLTDGNKIHTANDIANVLNGNDLQSSEAEETIDTTVCEGTITVNDILCEAYEVTLKNGNKEHMAVDQQGNWYLKKNDTYVPVILGADGNITVGNEKSQIGSEDGITSTILKAIGNVEDCEISESGNGQINGQNCVFYDATKDGKVVAKLACAKTEDGTWYYCANNQDFYRIVIYENATAWLGRPVDNEVSAVKWIAKKISTYDGEVEADSIVSMNNVDCTKYRYLVGNDVAAYILVSVDGTWYYANASENYSVVQFTKKGIVI